MPKATTRQITVRGVRRVAEPVPAASNRFADLVGASPLPEAGFDLSDARSGDAEDYALPFTDDDLVELRLEGGLCLYTSMERLTGEVIPPGQSRGGKGELTIPRRIRLEGDGSRGGEELLVEAIQKIDLKGKIVDKITEKAGAAAARLVAGWLENQLVGEGGLFTIDEIRASGADEQRVPEPAARDDITTKRPILVFVHGTASSTLGSFSDLWTENADNVWSGLEHDYKDGIYGFEHRTLSTSPIRNALELVRSLPQGARLHIVSHSRGGLVGELLCRGQLKDRDPFTQDDLELFSPEDNSYLERIMALGAEKASYEQHVEDLRALNEALKKSQLKVERFIRVACPARGTTLASGKLDLYLSVLLNVVGMIPGLKASGVFDFLKAFTLATAKQRTAPEALPGLEAQMPGSPLITMLNGTREATAAHLAVISGDIEPAGILRKLALLLVDRFYESDHDLVVNTPSMDGGGKRLGPVPQLSRQGAQVHHFSYFSMDASRRGLLAALRQDGIPAGFSVAERRPVRIARSLPRGKTAAEVPAVFLLPGISGSHLEVDGNRVWVDPFDLVRGKFTKLDIDADGVEPGDPIASAYGDLADFLGRTHEVIPFAYDWRKSILDASARLAAAVDERLGQSGQPVRIVAHSMGGLVARGMMTAHHPVWERMRAREGSRVLMLGTPNRGSHSIPRLLANQNRLMKWLARVDLHNNAYELLATMSEFPGVLELLPVTDEEDFFKSAIWNQFAEVMGKKGRKRWQKPTRQALEAAARTWKKLNDMEFDTERVFYIAGKAKETPVDVFIDKGRIRFMATPEGDGQVPWETGIPEKIRQVRHCWYVDAIHGDLANHKPAFDAILEILNEGDTRQLATRPPVSRGAGELREMAEDEVDFQPSAEMLAAAALGATPYAQAAGEPAPPRVNVSVCHGSLRFVKCPLMVSHYRDDAIVSAEAELDRQLDGRLSRKYRLCIYPGEKNTSAVLLNVDGTSRFPGALVVGLGPVGELSQGRLTETIQNAVLCYADAVRERKELDGKPIELATLLIGTGSGGLALDDAMAAILKAVVGANRLLAGNTQNTDRTIESLQFIELYEDVAVQAQHCLRTLASSTEFGATVNAGDTLEIGDGGRRRVSYSEDSAWWQRMSIKTTEQGELEFMALTKRAQAPVRPVTVERFSVDPFIESAMASTRHDTQAGKVLFEMLVPHEFKSYARESRDLVLVVDEKSAVYPWELLEYDGHGGRQALALQAGMMRQLASSRGENRNLCRNQRALVVGDPVSDWPELAGAQAEAKAVAHVLGRDFGECKLLFRPAGREVQAALMAGGCQILHLSGHGAFEYPVSDDPDETVTGMVIGKNYFLTPNMISQMPATPEFVFINCCHLANAADRRPEQTRSRHRLAANLAVQLINQGVRGVIAAGWEVDDRAAVTFALRFYDRLLAGVPIGKAVLEARKAAHNEHPTVDTWGAYQCYGDYGYRLESIRLAVSAARRPGPVSIAEQVAELTNIAQDAKTATENGAESLRERLDEIENMLKDKNWLANGEIQLALGQARGELDQFEAAIEAYDKAISSEKGHGTLKSVEQRENLRVRLAVAEAGKAQRLFAEDRNSEAADLLSMANDRITEAETVLRLLNENFGETVERLSLLGSARKRAAMIHVREGLNRTEARRAIVEELDAMGTGYEKAYELARTKTKADYAYPLFNWLTARWLRSVLDRRYKLQADFDQRLDECREANSVPEINSEHFWDAIARADCEMLQSLKAGRFGSDCPEILERYSSIRKVAASPRQFRSVVEHLEFLRDMLGYSADAASFGKLDDLIGGLRS